MKVDDVDDFLSAVEIGCLALTAYVNKNFQARGAVQDAENALREINQRFEQHGVGYQFESNHIIRVDSKIAHAEIVKPALQLLTAPMFTKANKEFHSSHRHYRAGAYKDCVTAANRAFESALKAICDTEGWPYDRGDRASELVTKVTNNGLFTHDFDKSFSAYVAMLKTGLPSVRNDAGGHGEGIAAAAVTAQIARFALKSHGVEHSPAWRVLPRLEGTIAPPRNANSTGADLRISAQAHRLLFENCDRVARLETSDGRNRHGATHPILRPRRQFDAPYRRDGRRSFCAASRRRGRSDRRSSPVTRECGGPTPISCAAPRTSQLGCAPLGWRKATASASGRRMSANGCWRNSARRSPGSFSSISIPPTGCTNSNTR